MDTSPLLLRNARIVGAGDARHDVRIADGHVVEIGPTGSLKGDICDVKDRWVMPGLWDHHVHFTQWARMRSRLDVSHAMSAAQTAFMVAERHRTDTNQLGTLAGFGFRDALWPDLPTAPILDAAVAGRPVVLISGDLHSVWVNNAARRHYDLVHAGLLREEEAFAVQTQLAEEARDVQHVLTSQAADEAATRGVVGIVDLEMEDNVTLWAQRIADDVRPLRVRAGFYKGMLEEMIERGHRTGQLIDGTHGLLTVGPLKIITDGSLNTRTAFCHEPYPGTVDHGVNNVPPEQLEELMREAVEHGFEVAIHAIGDLANTLALDLFEETGVRGSIEHAQLLRASDISRFAELGVVASVQPEHAHDDRDVADALWPGRTARAFPLASLHAAGARLTLGSDAPVAPLDPWVAMAAAIDRSRDGRDPWHPEQQLDRVAALRASTEYPQVAVGMPADVVVSEVDPLTAPAPQVRTAPVALTLVSGMVTHMSSDLDL